jgi:hypothetical protein
MVLAPPRSAMVIAVGATSSLLMKSNSAQTTYHSEFAMQIASGIDFAL